MAEHSTIGWTDATWPIVAGCEYESPGCSNCWAVRDSWRLAHNPHPKVREAFAGTVRKVEGKLVWSGVVRPLPDRLDWPLRWRKPRRIFVCSQADLFHPKVPDEFIADVFEVMARCPQHEFQVLTKHAARMHQLLAHDLPYEGPQWPLPNVWIGVTVEDQRRADERVPYLLRAPAAKRWLSVEPMLEAIDLTNIRTFDEGHTERGTLHELADLDWVVCGGESAQTRANTRPFDIAWARALRHQCQAAGVAFFMKQLGSRPQISDGRDLPTGVACGWNHDLQSWDFPRPTGKTSRYKFHEPEHWPADLRVQEFPS